MKMEFTRSGPVEKVSETKRNFHKLGAAVALFSTLTFGAPAIAQDKMTCSTAKSGDKMTPAEFLKYDAATTKKFRGNDNLELVKKGDMQACLGDCIVMILPGGKDELHAAIGTLDHHLAIAGKMDGTERLSVGIRTPENDWKNVAVHPLAITAQRYKEMTGHLPQAYRLVVEEGVDPKEGPYQQIYAIPTEQKGAMPDFSKDGLPYSSSAYVAGKAYGNEGLICKPPAMALNRK
jgi:hypothetical protein